MRPVNDPAEQAPTAGRVPPLPLVIVSTTLVALFYLFGASFVQLLNPGFGVWFSEAFVFLGLPFIIVRMSGRDPLGWTGLRFTGVGQTAFGFALGAANFFAIAIPLHFVATKLFPESVTEMFDASRIFRDRSPIDLVLILTGVTIAAPIGEEYFFRGVLQNALTEAKRRALVAIVITAVIFSAFHIDPVGFVARVELGILFGWLFLRTGSIWPAVGAHAANNAITTALFFAYGDQEQASETAPLREQVLELASVAGVGLIAGVGLLILAAKVPSLLSRHEPVIRELPPPPSFWRLAAPWALAAFMSLALFLALDYRGAMLNMFDSTSPLPERAEEDEAAQEKLRQLRREARAGEVPLDDYRAARRQLIEKYPQKPAPDLLPETPGPLPPEGEATPPG